MIDRRRWLQVTALAGPAAVWSRSWAAPATDAAGRLVVVFLRGACDALAALVPHSDPFYFEARPRIALSRPDAADPDASVALDARWALHPALVGTFLPMWHARRLAIVPFAGHPVMSRSHFEAQDLMEAGLGPGQRVRGDDGFLNRLLAELGADSAAVSFTPSLPLALRGRLTVANAPLRRVEGAAIDESYEDLVLRMYAGHPLHGAVRDGLGLRRDVGAALAAEMTSASRQAPRAGGFALEGGRLGRFLREHREHAVSFVDIGGWDTHIAQGGAHGQLATQLRHLATGLGDLATELGAEWSRTAVVVLSEFGRTFRENGNRGTDHGRGGAIWLLGGAVTGGRIVGEQVSLRPDTLHEDRDLPVLNDSRAVLAELFGRLFGLSAEAVRRVFPGLDAGAARFGIA